ncbi:bifunctional phosphoribosyl-AMP cyclohydrolase/phosphoribosyl-ATP diphosphatase HisIE [Roseburia sp. BX1005]|uniref:Histidine biosynthesis bifunctional protein HisIE n=1 Tax=Roseburia zhanii TaxID=2763064 RepID=A0A923LMN5_9FIRM|nr:bifunctional phosphoribosyl-AMP cyclohydrolase/phosphoribosyl-ATP diphosphatase HisIE [Roseburia zhanii]MBC5713705.1 bifunctional phosphoribosyl-AMP cyclohydrolase/phosphoribosyl-ATP diphosphatase HisIE [Roseburia zhanii]
MEFKNIVATIYLKDGKAVKSPTDLTSAGDVFEKAKMYNDCGIDKIFIFDLSEDDEEHEKNLQTIKDLNRNLEIKVCAGGNINRFEDIKKIFYTGCLQVMLNGSKPESIALAEEASKRFGKDRILVSVKNVDFIFKNKEAMEENFHEMLVLDKTMLDAVENITTIPAVVVVDDYDIQEIVDILKRDSVRGITGQFVTDPDIDIMLLKTELSTHGLHMVNFTSALQWSDFKVNSDGMVPVIVQDYRTDEVLMLAYMNEEAFLCTISSGKMTYFSRSRQEIWMKGETSGHIQYVKSLTADCDYDTILAKVSQIGVACHTGNPTCFFNPIVKKEYVEKNPLKIFDEVYDLILDRKAHPKEGSYTNYLFDKGIDKILKKVGEENTEIIIAAKNPNPEEIKYEISDYLYHLMVLMAERGVTWEDVTQELSQR